MVMGLSLPVRSVAPMFGLALLVASGLSSAEEEALCKAGTGYQPVCGIAPPEDLELSPDGKHLYMSITPGLAGQQKPRLQIRDLTTAITRDVTVKVQPEAGWGDGACQPPEMGVGAHGIHLSERPDGSHQLLVVNHMGREAIEFLEMVPAGDSWDALWRGCVENDGLGKFNDVAATPEGGFVATVMFVSETMQPPMPLGELLDGRDTGYLMQWSGKHGLNKLPGSDGPFPNGVQVTADGRHAWFAAWTANEIVRYDLEINAITARVDAGYMVDNLSWTADGRLLAAGVPEPEAFQQCFEKHAERCPMGVRVSSLAVGSSGLDHELIFSAEPGVMEGASVALEVGDEIYVGTFTGDRLIRLTQNMKPGELGQ